jgi:Ca2+-binding EF-hand superfamily protein
MPQPFLRLELFNPRKQPLALADRAKRYDERTLDMKLGDADVEVSVSDLGRSFSQFANSSRFYYQQFEIADADKKGYVTRKEAQQVDFLIDVFTFADRDGDGKLTKQELKTYLDMQTLGSTCFITVNVTEVGRSLFDQLDANGDGRLSVRELRTAWARLKAFDTKNEGGLTRSMLPRKFRASLSQGQNGFQGRTRRSQVSRAPLWFQKMDRNNDGDVSPREFLGTEEEFRMLDEDGDGLISAEEAIRAEARLKNKALSKR